MRKGGGSTEIGPNLPEKIQKRGMDPVKKYKYKKGKKKDWLKLFSGEKGGKQGKGPGIQRFTKCL